MEDPAAGRLAGRPMGPKWARGAARGSLRPAGEYTIYICDGPCLSYPMAGRGALSAGGVLAYFGKALLLHSNEGEFEPLTLQFRGPASATLS